MARTILITGGARGLGGALVQEFATDHDVALVWNSSPPTDMPDGVLAIQGDLTEPGCCADVIAQVMDRFGRLDVIVNNAGIVEMSPKDVFDGPAQRAILDVNLLAPGDLLAAALPHLKEGASVVNISSVNAVLPPAGASIYGASKAALNLWTKAMAKELGPQGIRVNAVAPGAFEVADKPRPDELIKAFVGMTALGRLGTAEDITPVVRFLASDAARFVTGEVITASGGYRL
ncbi:SDR family NAD(P)-dependent oxidoreductase [Cognatishimia sp. MH4019]|uniref:SDR family NAD(P)-dependent oxidoreductase n=1 Tax=Cognatishimia sp. MH4019 TaxID=2854030 RepID=UPI001CD2FF33|nr:SDR family oxidoreductase [Cognatishimia sp. MH4019]